MSRRTFLNTDGSVTVCVHHCFLRDRWWRRVIELTGNWQKSDSKMRHRQSLAIKGFKQWFFILSPSNFLECCDAGPHITFGSISDLYSVSWLRKCIVYFFIKKFFARRANLDLSMIFSTYFFTCCHSVTMINWWGEMLQVADFIWAQAVRGVKVTREDSKEDNFENSQIKTYRSKKNCLVILNGFM